MPIAVAVLTASVLALAAGPAGASEIRIALDPDGKKRPEEPVTAALSPGRHLTRDAATSLLERGTVRLACVESNRHSVLAQVDAPGGAGGPVELTWIETWPRGARSLTYTLSLDSDADVPVTGPGFRFSRTEGGRLVEYAGRPVALRETAFDPARREETFKPFLHLYSPVTGRLLTKGPGGLYSHHRGLFFGYSKVGIGERVRDYWHCRNVIQRHAGFDPDRDLVGPVRARYAAFTEWLPDGGEPELRDTREITFWRVDDHRWACDVNLALESLAGPVTLDGDPQHAGFQIRLSQALADPAGVRYVRPRGAVDRGNDVWAFCPWVVGLFELDGTAYAVTHLDHPSNPAPTVYSTRGYGRFGAFFRGAAGTGDSVAARYRIWLDARDEGESARLAPLRSAAFADPPRVTVSR